MTETRSTRHRRRIERRRRGVLFLVAVGLLLADVATATTGAVGGAPYRVNGGRVATANLGGGTTSTSSSSSSTSSVPTSSTTVARSAASSSPLGNAGGRAGAGGSTAVAGPASGGCANTACLTLNAAQTSGPFGHPGSGINELPGTPNTAALRAIGTNMYRSAPGYRNGQIDWSGWDAAVAGGAKTTLILSTLWAFHNGQQYPPTPWSDWNAYNTWVKETVAAVVASGHEVDYWDLINEPGWHNTYSPSDFASETPGELLEQFLDTYQDIKSVLPAAQIVGPSLGYMTFSPIPTNSGIWSITHEFDMTTFLQFCAQHNLQLAAVAWHQDSASPAQVEQWAAQTWAVIRSLPALGQPAMYLDEYAIQATQPVPGWDIGYLAALAAEGITYSVRSCWDGCRPSTLDGLLLPNGSPTADWYERLAYAQMSGQSMTTTSTDPAIASLGAVSSGQVTALIGRMQGCGSPASWCNQFPYSWFGSFQAESVGVNVVLPWTSTNVTVKLSHVSSNPGAAVSGPAADSPSGVRLSPYGPGRELLSFSIPSFADGDGYILTVSHS